MWWDIFLTVQMYLLFQSYASATSPLVTLPNGKVEGYFKNTKGGRVYAAFEGIPYALPPVGKYRFEESKPMKPWFGTWQAKTLTKCMQNYHYASPGEDPVMGDEDCLHVNVYTPSVTDAAVRDVIVFIHGGAFMFNSGATYGEKYLMEYDVVYVSLNYRLGPLGFLSTEDRILPGNVGLKDQLLALRWIKENIRYFGGNPDSITLTGMSAGGASVQIMTLTPRARDVQLFHRAIAQSGTALNPWVMVEKSREKAIELGKLVGCPAYDMREMVKCMKYRPAKQLVAAVSHFQPWNYNPFSPFGVVVDPWSDTPVLPQHPYRLLKSKNVLNVPMIFSNVGSEGLYPAAGFLGNNLLPELNERWNDLIPFVLDYNNTINSDLIVDTSQKIKKFYFGSEQLNNATFPTLIELISDRLFLVDIERSVRLHAAAITEPVYHYYFTYRGAHSRSDLRTKSTEKYGAAHCDDTTHVLSANVDMRSTPKDAQMSDAMINIWLSFAKNSIPKVANIEWQSTSNDVGQPFSYLEINSPDDMKMKSVEYLGQRVNFWDTIGFKENQNLPTVRDEL